MTYNIETISTFRPRVCGLATFNDHLITSFLPYTKEVNSARVTAIDNKDRHESSYRAPVDLVIHQNNPRSWQRAGATILQRSLERDDPTAIIGQHEYGVDGYWGQGNNFAELAKLFSGYNHLVNTYYLHTVLRDPNDHQRATLQELGKYADTLFVPTISATEILAHEPYNIDRNKLQHMDHGIRENPDRDRLQTKEKMHVNDLLVVTTLGLKSPAKGLEYSIEAYGKFLSESLTRNQRKDIVYIIAGQYHPEFEQADEGKYHAEYEAKLNEVMNEHKLKSLRVKDGKDFQNLKQEDFAHYDVVFLEKSLDEEELIDFYAATNVLLYLPRSQQQISSGILADCIGSGRASIATKSEYAMELLGHGEHKRRVQGINDPLARGILVDLDGEQNDVPNVKQAAQGLDYLVFNPKARLRMESQANQRGREMRWHIVAGKMLEHIDLMYEEKNKNRGRGKEFQRRKKSSLKK